MSTLKKFLIFAICIVISFYGMSTQANVWQPSSGYTQIPIWPKGKMPDALPDSKTEYVTTINHPLIAGKTYTEVWDVTQPTMTVILQK